MNKQQYRHARALVRANGLYALRWLQVADAKTMHALAHQTDDYLSERTWLASHIARTWRHSVQPSHMVRAIPCPSQRSAMHAATLERTYAIQREHLLGILVDCRA